MPFVPTPAAFFFGGGRDCYPAHIFCRSGAAGVGIHGTVFYRLYCYRRHSLPGCLFYTGCYPAHNSREPELESPAQFAAGGVVIGSTISVRCAARGKKFRLLLGAQFRLLSAGGRLLSTAQFARCGKLIIVIGSTIRILGGFPKVSKPGCYPAHISGSGVVIGRTVSKL